MAGRYPDVETQSTTRQQPACFFASDIQKLVDRRQWMNLDSMFKNETLILTLKQHLFAAHFVVTSNNVQQARQTTVNEYHFTDWLHSKYK